MRTKVSLALVGLVSLAATSVAVAHGIEGAKTSKAVSATFSATAGKVTTRTCTTPDNKTIAVVDGRYTGTSTGDADLTGTITLRAHSVVNTTDKVGTVSGAFKISGPNVSTKGAFSAVWNNGSLAGLSAGRVHGGSRLLANVSSTFDPASGFGAGSKIGGGTTGGSAVEIGSRSCKPSQATSAKSEAHGPITALDSASITVATVTCALPPDKQSAINAKFKKGDVVEIRCAVVNGTNTLTRIERHH